MRGRADTPKPARFDDIAKRLKKQLGELPALYQLRVALRFWTTPEVGVVERVRARYRPAAAAAFVRDATRFWEHTRG